MNYLTEQRLFSCLSAGEKARQEGNYGTAEVFYRRALAIAEASTELDVSDHALVLQQLANMYCEIGRSNDAEEIYRRICHIWERARGAENPALALSLEALAVIHRTQGKHDEAISAKQRARQIWNRLLKIDSEAQKNNAEQTERTA